MRTYRLLIGAASLVASLLVACDAAAPVYFDADYTGRPYPPECRRDLSHLPVPVTFVARAKLYEINQAAGGATIAHTARLDGLYVRHLDGTSAIYVA